MSNVPSMGEWSVNEMMKATGLITEIGEMLCAEAMLALMSGQVREEAQVDPNMLSTLKALLDDLHNTGGDAAVERFAHVILTMQKTSRVFLDGLAQGMEASGMMMPNPDTVVIPDTVPDGLEGI